jgi:hypothetical protein
VENARHDLVWKGADRYDVEGVLKSGYIRLGLLHFHLARGDQLQSTGYGARNRSVHIVTQIFGSITISELRQAGDGI